MRRGGKDDVLVEENEKAPAVLKSVPEANTKVKAIEAKKPSMDGVKTDGLKGILAELGSVDGIIKCFLVNREGITVVSIGETGNNADLGKQAVIIFESTERSVNQLQQGKLQQVLITADNGHILLVTFTDYILIVLANSRINLGLLRLTLDSVTKKVEKIL